jgi:hypothetical protein
MTHQGYRYALQERLKSFSQDSTVADSLGFSIFSAVLIVGNAIVIGLEIELGRIDLPVSERIPWCVS